MELADRYGVKVKESSVGSIGFVGGVGRPEAKSVDDDNPAGSSYLQRENALLTQRNSLPELASVGKFPKRLTIFTQGDAADAVFYIQEGKVSITVVSPIGKEDVPQTVIPKISQETLAEMVRTTPPWVSFFMNRFGKLRFIDDGGGGMQVHRSLLNIVLHD